MARTATTERRIEHIANMMRHLEWRTGCSGPDLAKRWRLSMSSVEKLSAEASKRVRKEIADPDSVTTIVAAALSKVLHDALADGDRRSVIRAAEVWARIAGGMLPKPPATQTQSTHGGVRLYLPAQHCETCSGRGEAEQQPCSACGGTGHQSLAPAPYDPCEGPYSAG